MNTIVELPFPLKFSKEYRSQFGKIQYLQQTLSITGTFRYGFSSKYNTLCIKLSDNSLEKLKTISKWLKEWHTSIKITDDKDGKSCVNVKVKKNQKFKECKAGELFDYKIGLSLFEDHDGNVFASLIV